MNANRRRVSSKRPRRGLCALAGLLCAFAGGPPAAAQSGCDPSTMCCTSFDSGSPCGGVGVATQGNVSGLDLGVGNPINLLNGNKFQREVDMPPLPGVLGLELVRYYNSSDTRNGLLGRGWRLSYETELRVRPRGLELLQADGTRVLFGPAQGEVHRPRDPLLGLVQRLPGAQGSEYLWRWADGRELRFNARGQLEQIRAPSGEFVSLRHDPRGGLLEVIDPAGRRLGLQTLDKDSARSGERFRGVQSIQTPVGRYRYEYGAEAAAGSGAPVAERIANLVRVLYPDAAGGDSGAPVGRVYHHEDARFPTLLTGISALGAVGSERLSTWAYDAQRRAVRSESGGAAPKRVSLRWRSGPRGQAQALVEDEAGGSTVYTLGMVAGERRVLRQDGAAPVRYAYDALGRLVEQTRLDAQGRPLLTQRTERDAYGRPMRLSDTVYEHGRAQPAQWRARYRYAEPDARDPLALPDPRPVFIAMPSVLARHQRTVHIAYNAARQVVSVSEAGFGGVDAQGRAAPDGVPLSRLTRYAYAQLNGRSVRVRSDEPLPNGPLNSPADSDITLYEWDARGERLLSVTQPGALVSHFQHEAGTGRLSAMTDPAGGVSEWRDPVAALGRPRAILSGGRLSHLGFDLRGRVSRVRVGETLVWQAQGEALGAASGQGAVFEQDAWERPTDWYAGAHRVLSARWGGIGTAAERRVLRWDTEGTYAERAFNDFGEMEGVRHAQQSWRYAVRDEAGRIVAITDARGARQRVRRDIAGRVLSVEHWAPGEDRVQQVLTRHYDGARLVEERLHDQDGVRSTHYAYSVQGALVRETLRIEPAGELGQAMAQAVTLSTAYQHGAGGELLARHIRDASGRTLSLRQALDAQGQLARVHTHGVWPHWLGGGREIVRALAWQDGTRLQYATRIEHGDGTVDLFEPVPAAAPPPGAALGASDPAGGPSPVARPAIDLRSIQASGLRRRAPGLKHDISGFPAFVRTRLGLQGLHWNAVGQLAQTRREDGRSRYVYDARGRRVATLVFDAKGQASARLAWYEEHRLLAEADAEGRLTHAYAHLGHRPLAQLVLPRGLSWAAFQAWLFGPTVRHLHTARAGRVLSVSEAGDTVWRDGEKPAGSGAEARAVHQPLRYVGQYHDPDSGLAYHGARFFEPEAGRFLSPDPSGVADAIDGLAPSRLLDIYAYAGDQPDEYFDPDGAARIRYFAITSNAQGKTMGSTQGFVKARWAFIVDNVAAGGDASALGQQRNRYAAAGTSLLVDVAGSFQEAGGAAVFGPEATTERRFFEHYKEQLISLEPFTIDDMDDDNATALIASYVEADRKAVFSNGQACPARSLLLPPIRFADEELPIDVTSARSYNPSKPSEVLASSQRIVQCGEKAKTDVVERRIQKYNFGFMLLESNPPQIYMDCSKDGCPGRSLRGTVLKDYVASYGQTQFIGTTIVEKLMKLRSGSAATSEERRALRLDEKALWSAVSKALERARFVTERFDELAKRGVEWRATDEASRLAFKHGSGLDDRAAESMWNDIRRWHDQPAPNLGGEARAAFGTTVLMADPQVRDYLMDIFRDSQPGGTFAQVSIAFARSNLLDVAKHVDQSNTWPQALPDGSVHPQWLQRQRRIEIELAARVARLHNGDIGGLALQGSLDALMARDRRANGRQYARRFLNAPEYPVMQPADATRQQPVADYFALRCASELPKSVAKPGLQMTPLKP